MKKLLLSLTLFSMTLLLTSFVFKTNFLNNDEKIKKLVETSIKETISKSCKDYKSISLNVKDSILISEFISLDSIMMSNMINYDTSDFFRAMKKENIKFSLGYLQKVNPNIIDNDVQKMYMEKNYSIMTIHKALINYINDNKLNYKNKYLSTCVNIFTFKDELGVTQKDTAMFMYTPEKIRLFSLASKYEKGVNFVGSHKIIRKFSKETFDKQKTTPKVK